MSCCHRLSKKAKYDKRIAVTVFSFPPDKGNVGTAAYLNVFGSIHKVLKVGQLCLTDVHYAWVLSHIEGILVCVCLHKVSWKLGTYWCPLQLP